MEYAQIMMMVTCSYVFAGLGVVFGSICVAFLLQRFLVWANIITASSSITAVAYVALSGGSGVKSAGASLVCYGVQAIVLAVVILRFRCTGKNMSDPIVVITVATFKRPSGLRNLLESLRVAKARTESARVAVVVVDNDPLGSAEAVCQEFDDLLINYLVQERPGISATRNAGIAAARGADFIVFVDDDEVVSPDWLEELLTVQQHTGASLVAGPVLSILPKAHLRKLWRLGSSRGR